MHVRNRGRNRAFTLVEILIVVVILGILAAIVIPQFTSASESAKSSSLVSQLQTLRSQFELYQIQHNGDYPTLANLQQETASVTIHQLDGNQLFTQTVKHHNGYIKKFDFANVPNGRYVLTVEHEGKEYTKVIYVNEETVMLSPVSEQ